MQLNNLDYYLITRELQQLVSAFFNKVYLISEDGKFRFKFHSKEGEKNLFVNLGTELHLTKFSIDAETPSNFVMQLRKALDNSRVIEIKQVNFDRLLQITLEKETVHHLFFEMFGKGNMILCDEGLKILGVFRREEFDQRKLKSNAEYKLPPNEKRMPGELQIKDFEGLKGKVVASLSKIVNLSPTILDELVMQCSIDKQKDISGLANEERTIIAKRMNTLFDNFKPTAYFEENEGQRAGIAVSSIGLSKYSNYKKAEFETLSEAVDFFNEFTQFLREAKIESKKKVEAEKLEFQLSQMKSALTEFQAREDETRSIGEKIFENFEKVGHLLEQVKKLKKQGKPNDEIKKALQLVSITNQEVEVEL